eukprot:TRINITY_DN25167_c0_g1_i1.p1 TRINITY_DN25167_c0_g1~~TRINITY_DN25167_c0_g1_i1.p1  ORF type:complete len:204 (+),score=61.62 TRINITY_DN25167_c0_g1_i1:2-613(+)
MTGFNTKEEQQEGRYNADGSYELTMKRDPWLFQMDQIQESGGGKITSESSFVRSVTTKKEDPAAAVETTVALKRVLEHMSEAETVNSAIKRLGKMQDKKKNATKDSPLMVLINSAAQIVAEGEFSFHTYTHRQVKALLTEKLDDKYGTKKWLLKWEGKEEVHGPFSYQEVSAWHATGYLSAGYVADADNQPPAWVKGTELSLE